MSFTYNMKYLNNASQLHPSLLPTGSYSHFHVVVILRWQQPSQPAPKGGRSSNGHSMEAPRKLNWGYLENRAPFLKKHKVCTFCVDLNIISHQSAFIVNV